jgi:hypothetical protein
MKDLSKLLPCLLAFGSVAFADNAPIKHSQDGRLLSLPPTLDRADRIIVCVLPTPTPTPTPAPTPASTYPAAPAQTATPIPAPYFDDPAPELAITGAQTFVMELLLPSGQCPAKTCTIHGIPTEIEGENGQSHRPGEGGSKTSKEVCASKAVNDLLIPDGVLRYRLIQPFLSATRRPDAPPPGPNPQESEQESILAAVTRLTKGRLPSDGYILKGLKTSSSTEQLKNLAKALEELAEVLAKFTDQAQPAAELTGTLADLKLWIASRESKEKAEAKAAETRAEVARNGGTVFFEGEVVLGGFRRSLLVNHDGSLPQGVTTDFTPVAPHEHLLFYLQRPGSEKVQTKLDSGEKKPFDLNTAAMPDSSLRAKWVVERIGEGTNFKTGKDVALTISKAGEKPETVRQIAIPVIESYRWLVTTGVYFSGLARRSFYISDVANGTTTGSHTVTDSRVVVVPNGPTPTATPSDTTTVTTKTDTTSGLKGVVALSEEGKPNPAAGIFFSYYLKTRVNRPGKPFRTAHLVPAIVLGAKMDAPLKEGLLGLGIEPIRGLQIIGGFVKGRQIELGEGVQLGKPLLVSTTIPTVGRVSKATGFISLAIDVKPIAAELEKLLGRLF